MKSYAWRGLCKKVRSGKNLEHGLCGKASNNRNDVAREWIDEFLALLEEQGAPCAIQLVQFINKESNLVQETRDNDVDVIDLSSNLTRLGLYKQFVSFMTQRIVLLTRSQLREWFRTPRMLMSFLPSLHFCCIGMLTFQR
jgi:hypothetical protein